MVSEPRTNQTTYRAALAESYAGCTGLAQHGFVLSDPFHLYLVSKTIYGCRTTQEYGKEFCWFVPCAS
ncbi:MAG: hypothetical protein KatS3mg110_2136 [Pirellulaceae bacterium]|nr:MAG: hypothetical protein KatS3mg110_2136 [Pirellulaceae bacterium]